MTVEHPTPWRLAVTGYDRNSGLIFRELADGEQIPRELTLTAVDANGKKLEDDFFVGDEWVRIVRAVNLHDELVAALRESRGAVDDCMIREDDDAGQLLHRIDALLAKAKGEE